jgi:hypothetical protein
VKRRGQQEGEFDKGGDTAVKIFNFMYILEIFIIK